MSGKPEPVRIYVVAGEPSGDALGGRLMASLSDQLNQNVHFAGIGGPDMTRQGLSSLFPMSDLSVMGIAEVLPQIPKLLKRITETVKDIEQKQPHVVVTIDAPDFCFRVAKRLKGKGIPVVHMVAPTVWAWRPKRAAKVARFLDHMMCLFPFEPPYFEKEGLAATFVGHSVIESDAVNANGALYRKEMKIDPDIPLLAVLPGSRVGEVTRHLPIFRKTVDQLLTLIPDLQVLTVTTGNVAGIVKTELEQWAVPTHIVETSAQKYNAMAAADVALAASGTIALELGVVGTPAVIGYQMNALTVFLGKRLVTAKYASLINILLDKEVMPEHLIDQCTPDNLASSLKPLLLDETARAEQAGQLNKAIQMLGVGGQMTPSQKAAATVLGTLDLSPKTPATRD